jgi:general secretion pathway protein F
MGLIPLRVTAAAEEARSHAHALLSFAFKQKVSQRQLLYFTWELGTLLTAGLPLDRSLSVLSHLVQGERLKEVLAGLLEGVRAGKSLSGAIADHGDVFPKVYVNMVRAGEAGGNLESTLRYLADYLERSQELKDDIRSALTYPALLTAVAGVALLVLFVYVIPRFALIFKDVRHALPWMTVMVIEFSAALSRYGWVALLLLLVAAAVWVVYIRKPEGKLWWDRYRLRLWIVGDLMRQVEVARFARTLAALLKGGVPLLEALATVQRVVGNQFISRAIAAVHSRVKEGKGIAGPLRESGVFPPLALHMIAVGEETGRLDAMLADVGDHYDREVKRATRRLTVLLEPALIIGLGLVIGFIVLAMLNAIFSIHDLPF